MFHTIKEKCGVFSKSKYYRRRWLIVLEWELQGGDMVDCARMGILRRDMVGVPAW